MALGGGTWTSQNKVLPGAYINYVSAQRSGIDMSDRGVCALPMELNWGKDGEIFSVEAEDLDDVFMSVFGYAQTADEALPIREIFRHATTVYFYRLNSGEKASCQISTAKCSGIRGNDIRHVVSTNIDDETKFDVDTYLGTKKVDSQTVGSAEELEDNDFVSFITDAELEASAGIPLTGGTNGEVTGDSHQEALNKLESYTFNVLGCMSADTAIKAVYAEYCKRMRDKVGAKFTVIVHNYAHDYIGTINLKNTVSDTGAPEYALVPWLAGAEAGCAVNRTCENMTYDGEYTINIEYTQTQLKNAINAGELVFHKVGDSVNILSDINSYVSVTKEMNEDFQLNQVIRVLDQIAIDIASAFNKYYLGKVQNNTDGRIALWNDCVDLHNQLLDLGAIEDFEPDDITVSRGKGKRDVVEYEAVKPVCAMSKLYMTIEVS
jgi:hypothetical protein